MSEELPQCECGVRHKDRPHAWPDSRELRLRVLDALVTKSRAIPAETIRRHAPPPPDAYRGLKTDWFHPAAVERGLRLCDEDRLISAARYAGRPLVYRVTTAGVVFWRQYRQGDR